MSLTKLVVAIFPALFLAGCPYEGWVPPVNDVEISSAEDGMSPNCADDEVLDSDGFCIGNDANLDETITFRWVQEGVYSNPFHSDDIRPISVEYPLPEGVQRVQLQVNCYDHDLYSVPNLWNIVVDDIDPDNVVASITVSAREMASIERCDIFWRFYCDEGDRTCWSNFRSDPLREMNTLVGQTTTQVNDGPLETAGVDTYICGGQYSHCQSYTWGWFPNP